ncbi:MAG: nitrous oxide-stimulated promoter family protein [Fibrobacterota bacterium]
MNSKLQTLQIMISLYCRKTHYQQNPSAQCQERLDYALERISRCKNGEKESVCRKCSIHCKKPQIREKVRAVMR